MEAKTVYFEKAGPDNTDTVLKIARERAEQLGIKTVVVATTRGATAVKAMDVFKGLRVVAVSHSAGWKEPDTQELTEENRKAIEAKGGTIITTSHTFAGLHRAMRTQFSTYVVGDVVANTLRLFGDGMKVACEIAMMAADSGQVRCDEDVICISGSSRGADTAIVLTPVNSQRFFSMKVKEILCKPHF